MKEESANEVLQRQILLLQRRQSDELFLLKEQFNNTYESLKPINLIKKFFREIAQAPEVQSSLLGHLAGYLGKVVLTGGTVNPIKKLLGFILQQAISHIVSKNSGSIKAAGKDLLQFILRFKQK